MPSFFALYLWLSRDDVTKLSQIIPNVSKTVKIAEKIIPLDQRIRKQYLNSQVKNPKSPHVKLLKKAKAELLQQKITVDLNKTNAKKSTKIGYKK